MSNTTPVLCIHCQHHTVGKDQFIHHCAHEESKKQGMDLVTGKTYPVTCSIMRMQGAACGPEGKLFRLA